MFRWIIIFGSAMALAGCGGSDNPPATAQTNAAAAGGSPLTAPVDYLQAINKGQRSAEKTVDVASVNKAIQLFNIEEGRNPKSLDELVEKKFLPQIPQAPTGSKLQYDSASGTVKVVGQ